MSAPALDLQLVQPDYSALRGYERGAKAHASGHPVFIVQTFDEFNALEEGGIPALYPRDGEWNRALAILISGWDACFAFTAPEFRIRTGLLLDQYGVRMTLLTKEKLGGSDCLENWLYTNKMNFEVLAGLSDYADIYEPHSERTQRVNRLTATAYVWIDPNKIPERQWLYGRHLLRRYVSVTIAPGGIGKSRLLMGEALAMASGRDLFGQWVKSGLKVWIWNLEDDKEELDRCVQAACKHHSITEADIAGNLYIDSGRQQELCTAIIGSNGIEVLQPVYDNITQELIERKIDVLIIDPFVSSHRVNENDNGMIDAVVKAWAKVADKANCAIELVHHTRKEGSGEITVDSARGGSAIMGAARDVRVLNRMSDQQAKDYGIDNPRSYFRVGSDKSNFAPIEGAQWYQIESVDLLNDRQAIRGDSVGVCVKWSPPDPFDDITTAMFNSAMVRMSQNDCKYSPQANDWAGHAIADIIELDSKTSQGKAFIKRILRQWEQNGAIKKVTKRCNKSREDKPFYEVQDV